jgi:hypothetical protein
MFYSYLLVILPYIKYRSAHMSLQLLLKGQCHEIFDPRFFFIIENAESNFFDF